MRFFLGAAVSSILSLSAITGTAHAADLEASSAPILSGLYSELRGGALYHDMEDHESGADINAEILSRWAGLQFTIPVAGMHAMLRPHLGANLNLSGDTSAVYAGYTLTVDLTDRIFVEGGFGGMAHNGKHDARNPDRLSLGCSLLFRESASLGVRVTDHFNVSAMIEHSSNGGACEPNNGLTNAGVRIGYMF
ncbi:acyloxyacyl hydrolase [Roseibium litorale]|uniref:Acyloxyacyl hydrolase n=1 Tax=Roseibium litorale TaxID=2803841 RepID=A0ABR9CL67_9HYPH|nr:acyloxyacyl hydrolase [Roseibium litorale]MBD8891587.1 acyloxyacyl hydrolase [Roseibium litorale]